MNRNIRKFWGMAMLLSVLLIGCKPAEQLSEKPVIYLYPEEPTSVSVELDYAGELTVCYPEYQDGWQVTAYPDGTMENQQDGKQYRYLFWEGTGQMELAWSEGFVVPREEMADFLEDSLEQMGLIPEEYQDFIVYWLPKLQQAPYYQISFQQENYTDYAKLEISPQPDSMLRVFMACRPLERPIELTQQQLIPFERNGFTVVEWGGTLIDP